MGLKPQLTLLDAATGFPPVSPSKIAFQKSLLETNSQPAKSTDIGNVSEVPSIASDPTQISVFSGPQAATSNQVVRIVANLFNESFGFRPDGKPYRLSHRLTAERLGSTDYLFVAGDERSGVGYLYGKEIPCSYRRIAWIESMAVLPLYRMQGIATELVRRFCKATSGARRVGCVTPNPIAALIVSQVVNGKMFIDHCNPPRYLLKMLKEIRSNCFDLRGCAIDEKTLRIRTGFSPLSPSDEREWRPKKVCEAPPWWDSIKNMPNEFEAILVIER